MRIPNKFNGYSADNIRLYNDPVTLTALGTAAAGGAGTAAAVGTGAALGAGTAAGTGAALGLGAGAGLGTGTMAGTMLGGTGATLGTTAGLGAAGTSAGLGAAGAAVAPEVAATQGVMQAAAPADTTAALTDAQVQAMGTTNQMANVPTTATVDQTAASKAYYETVADQASNELNRNIASKVAAQQPNPYIEGIMQSDVGQMAKTGYDALSSGFNKATDFARKNPIPTALGIQAAQKYFQKEPEKEKYARRDMSGFSASAPTTAVYNPIYQPTSYMAVGGPVETMSAMNAVGENLGYPQSQFQTDIYSNPNVQRPEAMNMIAASSNATVDPYTGTQKFSKGGNPYLEQIKKEERERKEQAESAYESMQSKGAAAAKSTRDRTRTQQYKSPYAAALDEFKALAGRYKIPVAAPAKTSVDVMGEPETEIVAAGGGIMHGLGGYSDGGRLLKGPGDGVSDSIPATIGNRQPARLADGEFVIPARIVSELGNGSTEAGARQLYAMMERIQKSRRKSIGKGKVAVDSKSKKHLPV